jgi:hypothetical protein
MASKRDKLTQYFATLDKSKIKDLNATALAAQTAFITGQGIKDQIDANTSLIDKYQTLLNDLQKTGTSATDIQNLYAAEAGIPPAPPVADPASDQANYWTTISIEVSSSYTAEQSDSSSNSYSVGGGASWG